ncbi:tyrosine-type recombinase/integrase [Fictibacillus fluitans]|uniref:Tyrosine-type recombinase/integrase n=1 Tax=Fictibacillus fluitans TaxID=3058422 RepID=A0ABT8HUF1_9BACL|nr:tyrosine-type recombinase/integrase [Fictibacillus sp. NE201]MDN4524398.1 tyrosine-type recombinase/integrase [Fictibacillus sp. NE201]
MAKNMFQGKQRVKFSASRSNTRKASLTLVELQNLFITVKEAEGLRERTIQDYQHHFRYLRQWYEEYGQLTIKDISTTLVRKYVSHMKNEVGLSPVTINVRLRTLKCFLKFVFEEGYIEDNIAASIKLLKTEEDAIDVLTDDHIMRLLKTINRDEYTGFRDYVLIMLLIDTGIRIGEATTLTSQDIDLVQKSIYLQAKNVKTRKGRHIPFSNKIAKLLQELIKFNECHFVSNEIFLSVYGTPFQKRSIQKRLKQYKDKAGIKNVRVSPHSFRHYFAKNYILSGGDPFTLQLILGHSSMQMIRVYIQMNKSDTKLQHNKYSPIGKLNF